MRSLLVLTIISAAAASAAAYDGPRQLMCGATLNGVGGDMGKILERKSGVVKPIDCAQACADREGCASYQYCGYGSYDDTCLYVTAPEGTTPGTTQAGKGDCFLGSGHWRQVPTDKPFGGWTVGIACSSYAADPAPVAAEGEEGDGEPADAAAVPVVAAPVAIAAKKPAAAAAAPKKPLEEKAAVAPAPAAAPAKKAAPAPAGSPAWAAALPPSPVKAMTVPTAVTKVATVAQPELKAASIPEA